MEYLIAILIIIISALAWAAWRCYQKNKESEKEILDLAKEKDELADFGKGLEEYNKKMQEKKELAKEKIMELLKNKNKINHKDIVKALDVSKNSVVRYLDELEKEGRAKQVGKTGQGVFYTKL